MLNHFNAFIHAPKVGRLSWCYETLHLMSLVAGFADSSNGGTHDDGWGATDGSFQIASAYSFAEYGHFSSLEGPVVTCATRRAGVGEEISSPASAPYYFDLDPTDEVNDSGEWFGATAGALQPVSELGGKGPMTVSYQSLNLLNAMLRGRLQATKNASEMYEMLGSGDLLKQWTRLFRQSEFALVMQHKNTLLFYCTPKVNIWCTGLNGSFFYSTSKEAITAAYQFLWREYKLSFTSPSKLTEHMLTRSTYMERAYKPVIPEFCK